MPGGIRCLEAGAVGGPRFSVIAVIWAVACGIWNQDWSARGSWLPRAVHKRGRMLQGRSTEREPSSDAWAKWAKQAQLCMSRATPCPPSRPGGPPSHPRGCRGATAGPNMGDSGNKDEAMKVRGPRPAPVPPVGGTVRMGCQVLVWCLSRGLPRQLMQPPFLPTLLARRKAWSAPPTPHRPPSPSSNQPHLCPCSCPVPGDRSAGNGRGRPRQGGALRAESAQAAPLYPGGCGGGGRGGGTGDCGGGTGEGATNPLT